MSVSRICDGVKVKKIPVGAGLATSQWFPHRFIAKPAPTHGYICFWKSPKAMFSQQQGL
ncbi:hypothetical protein APA_3506 [Pseudanabaena sp. lw0831]|nr:hypothetical protein APA_3506 [Pseudanabaena sp. lw0831]